jgi:hypothetical protein
VTVSGKADKAARVSLSLKSVSGSAGKQENTFCKQVNGTWELI